MTMEAAGGHNGLLGMHNHNERKEWRAVAEGSGHDRLSGDGLAEHNRVNGSVRIRQNPVLRTESPRNGRMFPSDGSSGSSSDSDHHVSDLKSVPTHDAPHGEDIKLYHEAQHIHEHDSLSNGHASLPSNGLPLDFGGFNSKHLNETLEQRLHDVIRQREQLQRLEAELRAQFIARSEVLRVQNSFDEQTKQHASIVSNLQEQLQERDHRLHELEQKLEERERQLHANQKEASEAVNQVWAKDGLLREQTSELATLRRERENLLVEKKATLAQFESERAQLLSQLQDLEEQLQEKERQLQGIEEQHRTTQETLVYKDDQLREAQAWVQRAQELDAFYASTQSSLHAELRDKTEQINQLWMGQQRQLAEVERFHSQTIQRLRMEVAEVREQNRVFKSGSASNVESKSEPPVHVSSGDTEPSTVTDQSIKLRKGIAAMTNQVEHAPVLPLPASPTLGATAPVLVANPIPVLHQFAGQAQAIVPPMPAVPSQIAHTSLNQFSNPVIIQTQQQLPLVQAMQHSKLIQQPHSSQRFAQPQQLQVYSHFPETKSPLSLQTRGINHRQQQVDQQDRDQVGLDQGGPSNVMDFSHLVNVSASQHANIQLPMPAVHVRNQDSSEFPAKQVGQSVKLKHAEEEIKQEIYGKELTQLDTEEQQVMHEQGDKDEPFHELNIDAEPLKQTDPMQNFPQHTVIQQKEVLKNAIATEEGEHHHVIEPEEVGTNRETHAKHGTCVKIAPNIVTSSVRLSSTSEGNSKVTLPNLLDEKSLLACLVRAIPSDASARIKISTTLPNRLGKILVPLHWHDYKKQYGRLDDFISSHPKLFVIDGDFVHLRDGAHAIISATAAVAKVAAAAAAPSSLSTNWPPTVAVTPVAQCQVQRTRKQLTSVSMGEKERPGVHARQESLLSQTQMNGGSRLHQGLAHKDAVGKNSSSQHQPKLVTFNRVTHSDGQQIMSVLGCRSDGISLNASNTNALDFVEVASSTYGVSAATNKTNIKYGSRQGARLGAMEREPFARKDFTVLSQAQENRITRSS